jgi:hypothetical protein
MRPCFETGKALNVTCYCWKMARPCMWLTLGTGQDQACGSFLGEAHFAHGLTLGGAQCRADEEERLQGSIHAAAGSTAPEEEVQLITPTNRHPNAKPCYGKLVLLLLQPLPEKVFPLSVVMMQLEPPNVSLH